MPKVPTNIVNQILEREYGYESFINPSITSVEGDNPDSNIELRNLRCSRYIMPQINTYKDLMDYVISKQVYIISFVYNSGMNHIKKYNNRCEFTIRVNKEDKPVTKAYLLNKSEIENTIKILKNLKGDM